MLTWNSRNRFLTGTTTTAPVVGRPVFRSSSQSSGLKVQVTPDDYISACTLWWEADQTNWLVYNTDLLYCMDHKLLNERNTELSSTNLKPCARCSVQPLAQLQITEIVAGAVEIDTARKAWLQAASAKPVLVAQERRAWIRYLYACWTHSRPLRQMIVARKTTTNWPVEQKKLIQQCEQFLTDSMLRNLQNTCKMFCQQHRTVGDLMPTLPPARYQECGICRIVVKDP